MPQDGDTHMSKERTGGGSSSQGSRPWGRLLGVWRSDLSLDALQQQVMLQLAPFAQFNHLLTLVALAWAARGLPAAHAVQLVAAMSAAGSLCWWPYTRWLWRRGPLVFGRRVVRLQMLALTALQALALALMVWWAFPQAASGERVLMGGTMVGMIAVGALEMAVLPALGLVWVGVSGAGTLAALVAGGGPMVPVTATVLVVYLIFLALAVRAIAQVFGRMHRAQQAVQRERESVTLLLRDFEQQSSDWLWESDPLGRLKRVPQRLGELLGQAPERLRGQHLWAWFERSPALANAPVGRPEENLTATALTGQVLSPLARLQQRLAETRPFRGLELPLEGVGGRTWWRLSALPQFDAQGGLIGWRGVAQDVTAERRQTEQLQWQARTDALTGLANRRAFQARLHRVEAARPVLDAQTDTLPAPVEGLADPAAAQPPLCLLLLDLDGFKAVNDSLGHLMGDQLLQEVADRLSVCVREGELLARLGGDEFGLILPGALLEQETEARGHELLQMLRQPCQIQGHRIELRASIGLARLPEDAQDGAGLMQAADVALYSAKNAGRNQVQAFNLQLAERHARRRAVQADLAVALETGAFELFYQPLVEVADGRVSGFEALLRWNHPSCGRILPGDFIGAAEESGLIVPLGAWVLQQACAQAARWPLDGLGGPRLSVNLSAVQLATPGLVAQVQRSLEQSGLAAQRLDLEVTETALLRDLPASREVLAQLRALGVRVVLDDFGTGHSSLAYLRELAADGLKIDRSFVHAAQVDVVSAEIVRTLLALARTLGLQAVAEGVETQAQFDQMAELGCERVQGFHLGRPMPAEAVVNFVARADWLRLQPWAHTPLQPALMVKV